MSDEDEREAEYYEQLRAHYAKVAKMRADRLQRDAEMRHALRTYREPRASI